MFDECSRIKKKHFAFTAWRIALQLRLLRFLEERERERDLIYGTVFVLLHLDDTTVQQPRQQDDDDDDNDDDE